MVSDYTYDGKSRVTEYTCGMAGATGGSLGQTYAYTYDDTNSTLSSVTVTASGVSDTLSFSYDPLQRLTAKTLARTGLTLAQTYSYKTISGNRTSTLISGLTQKTGGSTTDSYTYTYDSLGNITAINRSGYEPLSYTYDTQNQLTKVIEGDFRYEYAYDTYGNILSVKTYDNATSELMSTNTYTYGDSQWLDRLTKFNGTTITYDNIGNPLSYYNGSSYTFTWNGRELVKAVKGGVTTTYKYGADGLRTQKTVGSTTYNYYYGDGLLIRQTWGSNYMDFLYDESGSAYSFIYNGTQYYYVRNLQGDVVKILNTSGAVVASYTYDAWGKVTNSGNVVGQYNPIRYRGYYYDTDTGFYYLQSRYYDPAIKRFINADGYINANGDFIGFNMFAYCSNNPINHIDKNGTSTEALRQTLPLLPVFSLIDGPLPIADIITGLFIVAVFYVLDSQDDSLEYSDVMVESSYGTGSPNNNDDDDYDDDFYNDDSNFSRKEKIGKPKGKTPGNNRAQNKQFKDATKGLSKKNRRIIHDDITKSGQGYHDIKAMADEFLVLIIYLFGIEDQE